jgi:hypothetical protein
VTEVNLAPVLPVQTNRTVGELNLLTVTNTATDADLPANPLSYQLINSPAGASISASGVISWTPAETHGPGAFTFTTVVHDGSVNVTNSFAVIVDEVNQPPLPPGQTNRIIAELTLLTVTNTAVDADLPSNALTYQLLQPPAGAAISAAGVITWTPGEDQGPGTNTITAVVSDGTVSVTNSFVVIVTEANVAPALPVQTNRSINELTLLIVTNTATDSDLPADTLTYQLLDAPGNASIDSAGVITWTPNEAQGPVTNTIITVVSDGLASATNSFTVTVAEVNSAPVLPVQTNRTLPELTLLTVTNTAADADLPANALTYQLLAPPAGAVIDANGVITWTPSEVQGPATVDLVTVASDGTVSVSNSFSVTVTEVNQAPELPVQATRTIAEFAGLIVTNTATDADLPANGLTYLLVNPPGGMSISASGVITWTPNEADAPSTNNVVTVVSDGTVSVTNAFPVVVTEINSSPVLNPIANRTVHAGTAVSFTAIALDADLPAQQLSFSLTDGPEGATINPATGAFEWRTSDADLNSTNAIEITVSDDGDPLASAVTTFVVTVVSRPMITSIVVSNDVVAVTWTSVPGLTYQLESADSPESPEWSAVGSEVSATANATTQTEAVSNGDRFFRVRLAP